MQHIKKLFIEEISNDPKDHEIASQLLETNSENTKFIIENVNFDIVSFEFTVSMT